EAAAYCHRVATAVGFASLAVWGTKKPLDAPETVHAARACGIAFQWTNILRDVLEDYRQGRIYLPMDELAHFGLDESRFGLLLDREHRTDDRERCQSREFEEKFERLLLQQISRCEMYYQSAKAMEDLLERDGRRIFQWMYGAYHRLYRKIAVRPLRVLDGRVRLSLLDKCSIALLGR
ncbi:MAG TPA: hypothetical protein DEB39_15190, partial [Planctomycetaceae bacterium]|nr:hypothetical protein [Planctomycetaceae bacterium]